jgi:ferredoxin
MKIFLLIIIAGMIVISLLYPFLRKKNARKRILKVNAENCVGCQHCLSRCRHGALRIVTDESGRHIIVNTDKCTGCGDCITACKHHALTLIERTKVKQ